ncbi:MAG TPA: Phenylacetic acid catabolic protein [Gemmatimonadales bacterium]|jgi:benzoyl-CoA 2,3-dioxygenase component B|nr:Phenylacetic acid catabolic protein [Gemmatimonadales bacterium]
MRRVNNFDEWIDYFHYWQDSIGVASKEFKGASVAEEFLGRSFRTFKFEAKFGPPESPTIEFGHYKGQSKWPTLMHIPDQRVRDALLNLIVYQGDTEFASVEQQRALLQNAPSDYDLFALMRVMTEEMRHGWQMSYLLCQHFGDEGRREAQKLLERRAEEGQRLLGSFNEIVENWLDFFTYTQFIDRDGKFQLKMLSTSAFQPLACSMGPMLKEESFHLGTGNNGLLRIVKAGKVPSDIIQRYFNKWIPTAFDLFGNDRSSSAHWAYVWGLKGRFNEREVESPADMGALNEASRELYRQEITRLVSRLNLAISDPARHLYIPHPAFNRKIGVHARMPFDVTGNELSPEAYPAYIASVTPSTEDRAQLREIFKENDWIEAKRAEDN